MSKTAYVVRHIHFENAGILEPLLIERGFSLEYIEAPLAIWLKDWNTRLMTMNRPYQTAVSI